ncbi:Fe2+-dependent dioxygenase [Undibacterium sp. RuTC16W]|uniref:Fe2+-dependent dioxygenase n=1 Tax=Undibacterium sp. RuTC16W TaxID=3413048 RepID=UPI003BF075CD
MLLAIPDVLSLDQINFCRDQLNQAQWVDGLASAGYQGSQVKHNLQLPESRPQALALGDLILATLERHPQFISAALPAVVYPPMFNLYGGGQHFGHHIDNAVRLLPGTGKKIRTDISATLFLSDPDEYEGGELQIVDTYGTHNVKLPAGHMVLYPSTSVHQVTPVTSGVRLASFFWVQSMIRDDAQRALLFSLDSSIQRLTAGGADTQAVLQLTGNYHNLLRMWAEPV